MVIIGIFTTGSLSQAQEFETFNSETFGDNYFSLEIVKNQPLADSQKQLATGDLTFFLGFRHVLQDRWMMGVHGGYKQFKIKGEDEEINIFSICQESLYLVRLSHPVYLSIGPKIYYLLPTKGRKVPPKRDRRFDREVGAAASMALHMFISNNILVSFRFDRWRGIDSEKFQGSETSLGLNYKLPN